MASCPECLIEFTPKANYKAHKCDCGSLLVLDNGKWTEHLPIHSDESDESEHITVPKGWEVEGWYEDESGTMRPKFVANPTRRFDPTQKAVPLYRKPPRERVGRGADDFRGGMDPAVRYLKGEPR